MFKAKISCCPGPDKRHAFLEKISSLTKNKARTHAAATEDISLRNSFCSREYISSQQMLKGLFLFSLIWMGVRRHPTVRRRAPRAASPAAVRCGDARLRTRVARMAPCSAI